MSRTPNNPKGLSGKAIFKLFVVYFVLYGMLATLAFFGVGTLLGPIGIGVLAIGGILVPAIATLLHVRKGRKSGVDEIAKRLP